MFLLYVCVTFMTTHFFYFELFALCIGDPLQDSGGRIVISRGSPSAKLCIIGEAPGVCEDKLGKPFVGRFDLKRLTIFK